MFEEIITKIKEMFSKDSNEISELVKTLSSHERKVLENRLNNVSINNANHNNEDINRTVKALNIISDIIDNRTNIKDKSIIEMINNMIFELYKMQYDLIDYNCNVLDIDYIISMYAMYSLVCDKETMVDKNLRTKIKELKDKTLKEENLNIEHKLYLSILCIVRRISDQNDVNEIKQLINTIQDDLNDMQKVEIKNEEIEYTTILIGIIGNLLYSIQSVAEYIIYGNNKNDNNIYTTIDTYIYNAMQIAEFSTNDRLNDIIKGLGKVLKLLCDNSIWKIAERSPIFNKFFKERNSKDDLLLSLLPSQRDSILDILTTKKSIVLNMPTSSGKSLLAELYILFTMQNNTMGEIKPTVAYIVPTNALINQTMYKLKEDFSTFNYNIQNALPFYKIDEIEEQILNQQHIDILVTTPEKLDVLVRQKHPSIKDLKLLVVDEAHNISDKSRGGKLELLLATIKQKKSDVNYLLLSPFIGNHDEIAKWLGGSEQDSLSKTLVWTPTKQYVGCNILSNKKTQSKVVYLPSARNNIVKEQIQIDINENLEIIKKEIKANGNDAYVRTIALIDKYIHLGSVLVLCKGAGICKKMTGKLLEVWNVKRKNTVVKDIEIENLKELIRIEFDENDILIKSLDYGIAYHHAEMPTIIKEEIEKLILKNKIKVVFTTTTLAQGMNFPITTVIFSTLKVGGSANSHELNNSEFWNIAGRAGRAYMDTEGHIITPYDSSNKATKNILSNYIKDDIEEIVSSLNILLREEYASAIFNYEFVKQNVALSNFLQYINHILTVSEGYNLNKVDTTIIRNVLSNSLLYKQVEWKSGFMEAQQKIVNFASRYVEHLQQSSENILKLADAFSISDISYSTMVGLVNGLKQEVVEQYGEENQEEHIKATKIILETKKSEYLAKIIDAISRIPEIQIQLVGQGKFDSKSIAKIVIGWVNGTSVKKIAENIKYENQTTEDILGICYKYINSRMKTFMPWGFAIYQNIVGDIETEEAKNLPSYIYYGVNNVEDVIIARVGVPRFAISIIKNILISRKINLNVANMAKITQEIKNITIKDLERYTNNGQLIKSLLDKYVR
jgi:hypothetical protein